MVTTRSSSRNDMGDVASPSALRDEEDWEEAPPDPGATIESLRSLGYSTASALADLIDNSVAKSATEISIVFTWAKDGGSWCVIADNGIGMSEAQLRTAMTIGGTDPLDSRSDRDLGRFGFGLKTASFSQARELTVASRTKRGTLSVRCWDLDVVRHTKKWTLHKRAPEGAEPLLDEFASLGSGTVILWRRLSAFPGVNEADTTTARRLINEHLTETCKHLGMVFARYISRDQLTIRVNRKKVVAWDPFLVSNPATQELPTETLSLNGRAVTVVPYVLPHESKLSPLEADSAGGPAGWNEQQGFYVYRRDRLITAGDWLGLGLARDDIHNLARIELDIPAEMDAEWQLDITKATVTPPAALKRDLKRIAEMTRRRAATVKRYRGAVVGGHRGSTRVQVWSQRSQHGETKLTINRKHPLVADLLEKAGPLHRSVNDLLRLVEQTVPALLLPSAPSERTPFEDEPPEELVRMAEATYEALLAQAMTRAEALQRLLNTEPFYMYPTIKDHFVGR